MFHGHVLLLRPALGAVARVVVPTVVVRQFSAFQVRVELAFGLGLRGC